jgi:hypothetical protein
MTSWVRLLRLWNFKPNFITHAAGVIYAVWRYEKGDREASFVAL